MKHRKEKNNGSMIVSAVYNVQTTLFDIGVNDTHFT